MIGRVYVLRGRQVMVLARAAWTKGTPRNVLILQDDGTMTVRPFRGLRTVAELIDGDAENAGQFASGHLRRTGRAFPLTLPAADGHHRDPHPGSEIGLGHPGSFAQGLHVRHCTTDPTNLERSVMLREVAGAALTTAPGRINHSDQE